MNELTKKLFKLEIGKSLTVKNTTGGTSGTYVRVPSGWIYQYSVRNSACCCFIPYSEEIDQWDMDLDIKKCPFCNSKEVFVVRGEYRFKVSCADCKAATKEYNKKEDAVSVWNSIKITVPKEL